MRRITQFVILASVLFIGLIALTITASRSATQTQPQATLEFRVEIIGPVNLHCSNTDFGFDFAEPYNIPPASLGQVTTRVVVNLSTGYSSDTGQYPFTTFPPDTQGLSGDKISESGYSVADGEPYTIVLTRFIYVNDTQMSVSMVIASCSAGPNRVPTEISTTNLDSWGRSASTGGSYQGPMPTPWGSFDLRIIVCNTQIFDKTLTRPIDEFTIIAGQAWLTSSTIIQDETGSRWIEVFMPTLKTGFVPASCVGDHW